MQKKIILNIAFCVPDVYFPRAFLWFHEKRVSIGSGDARDEARLRGDGLGTGAMGPV